MIRASTTRDVCRQSNWNRIALASINGDLAEGVSLEQIPAHDPKGLLDLRPVELCTTVHAPIVPAPVRAL
jgi:hypothetical protein